MGVVRFGGVGGCAWCRAVWVWMVPSGGGGAEQRAAPNIWKANERVAGPSRKSSVLPGAANAVPPGTR